MKTIRIATASSPATAAKPNVPSRVERILRVACMVCAPSARHDHNTGAAGVHIARRRAAARVERLDVLDEVADDVAGVVVWHGVVAVALAGVVEALALAGPARDVEGREVGDGHRGAAAAAERAVRGEEDLRDARV